MKPSPEKRKPGRPSGSGPSGEAELVSGLPKLSVSIRPRVRAALDAVAMVEGRVTWKVVESCILHYVDDLPTEDRKLVEAFISRAGGRYTP
jgi:hypothetical protein